MDYQSLSEYISSIREELLSRHLGKATQYSHNSFFFRLSGKDGKRLVIALTPNEPSFYLTDSEAEGSTLDSSFFAQFKKEIGNAFIEDVSLVNEDRIILLSLVTINSVFKEEKRLLYIELIPHHPNLIIADRDNTVITAFKNSSLQEKRPLMRGLKYVAPDKGISNKEGKHFDKEEFASFVEKKEEELSTIRKKDRFGGAIDTLKREEKALKRKEAAIEHDIEEAKVHLNDGEKGDFLYMNEDKITPKSSSFDFYGEEIALDPRRSLSGNATLFYKRAKKSKMAIKEGEIHLAKAKEKHQEVDSLLYLLANSSEEGLNIYAKEFGIVPTGSKEKKKSMSLPSASLPYFVDVDGVRILYGKNASQNDCLTFLIDTSKNHLWFHVQGYSGSHVMIKEENPNEELILSAAEIALIVSKKDDGDVIIAKRSSISRTPKKGEVILKSFKTIHIKKIREATVTLLKGEKKWEA